jgi:PAS domain S-box-containing protein
MTGHHRLEEIYGREVVEWTAPYDLDRNAEEVRKCAEYGFVRNLVIDYIDREGNITPVEINATMLRRPESVQIFTICRDITERKQAEKEKIRLESQLLQAQKMESVGRLAGALHMISTSAHCHPGICRIDHTVFRGSAVKDVGEIQGRPSIQDITINSSILKTTDHRAQACEAE